MPTCQRGKRTAELHLRFDAVAVAYCKAMRDLALTANTPSAIHAD
jgi:hypothetical protein